MIVFFFFNDPATTDISTLSLHAALPISHDDHQRAARPVAEARGARPAVRLHAGDPPRGPEQRPQERHDAQRTEEHTSELQSRQNLVCRLLLEKKKNKTTHHRLNMKTALL